MASDEGEKTEEPTSKRISDARKRGQVPRSKEAATFMVLFTVVLALWAMSGFLGKSMSEIMSHCFILTRDQIFSEDETGRLLLESLIDVGLPLIIIIFLLFISGFVGNLFLGGYNFSQEALQPKFSKLNPISGIGRIFSLNSLMELIKGLAKVGCVGLFCYHSLKGRTSEILNLSFLDTMYGVNEAITLLFQFMLIIVLALLPIVIIDVPFQKWHYTKQLRMTKQEIKDEFKDSEGNPQIKGRIKRLQYEMASRRMMKEVPKADVVVTNPTHYAVALKYDPNGTLAPQVVAKGVDLVAEKIKEIARECEVPVVPVPPLARSLYYTTDLEQEIPRGLFKAVAQVLAWVLAMKAYKIGKSPQRPNALDPNPEIPDELRF